MQFKNQYYIDKAQRLEKGIELFPSIYIEGAAASGKTIAVKMLCDKHPEVKSVVLNMDEFHNAEAFHEEIEKMKIQMESEAIWAVFENMPKGICREILVEMVHLVEKLPEKCRVIFVGREKPEEELLGLLWKRNMELFSPEALFLTEEEIQELIKNQGSSLSAAEVFTETGGWAGCADLMIRLSVNKPSVEGAKELRKCYEISSYIQKEILETLSSEEQEILRRAKVCPWLNEELVTEVWGMPDAEEHLEWLERKGLLVYNKAKKRWKIAALLCEHEWKQEQPQQFWEYLEKWYDSHGFVREALLCAEQLVDRKKYKEFILAHYNVVPFLGSSYEEVMHWKDISPENIYLRGMYCYAQQDFEGLKSEIQRLNPENSKLEKEVYINLLYMNPEITLDEWLDLLEMHTSNKVKVRLYGILGNAHIFLCGLRDLSGLFACSKKEENRKAKLWKERLGKEEWTAYLMAKMEYYLETERKDQISQEELELADEWYGEEPWQFRLAKLCLCYRLQGAEILEKNSEKLHRLEASLLCEDNDICVRNTIALTSIYSHRQKDSDKMTRWLRYTDEGVNVKVSEENYIMLCGQIKGYLYLNQYEKAERILRRVIPYMQNYRRFRFLAELLFQQSIVNWKEKNHGPALKNIIESFVVNGSSRYVTFYTGYGKPGMEILGEYVEWLKNQSPEGWHRKKKYNYGNVLRMPLEDYLELILRQMKREERQNPTVSEDVIEERLTMMEMIVLQNIGQGLTNAEICEKLDLKLTTVKSHVYSLYKKLGVNNRAQAILKGKELGIME